ncbi:putative receptor-like protein kinase, partial [Tanacetum coccineum]
AKKNAADSKLMLDILKLLAYNVRPPAYIMLISGDRDFTKALKSLNNLGFITILIYPDGCVSPALKEGSRCKFPLAELIKGNNFESIGTGMKLISGAEHTEHVKNAIF